MLVRLFVAIRLPEAVVNGLEHVRDRLGEFDGILRYPDVTGFHLTLAFLGELPEGGDEMVESGLRSACAGFGSFALALGAGGSFPEGGEARVIWLRVEGEVRRVSQLQKIVVKELGDLGLRLDKRPFSPPVTIARVARKAQRRGPPRNRGEQGESVERRSPSLPLCRPRKPVGD